MVRKIHIDQNKTIESLQNEFSAIYPYLKIEFFREPHVSGQGSAKNKMIGDATMLGFIQHVKKKGSIVVGNQLTVSDFENTFRDQFGLYVQVFRKSGNIWLETSATDNWTLEQQNEEGRILAQHFKMDKENPDDHDIY